MKILRVVSSMNPRLGGVVAAVDYAAKSLNKSKHYNVEVVCLDNPRDIWVKESDYCIHAVGGRATAYSISLPFLKWSVRNFKNYDFIVVDGLWRFVSVAGFLAKILGVKYAVMPHGMLDPYFKNNFISYLKKIPFWLFVDGPSIALSDFLLFTCEEEKRLSQKSYPVYKFDSRIARLGFDFSSYGGFSHADGVMFESEFKLQAKKVFLFVGRIDPKKGVDILIDSVALCRSVIDESVFVIAGPGDSDYLESLNLRAMALGISDNIVWAGMLDGEMKWSAYRRADYFVLPSHQENYGIVNVEALATETPVLITDKINIHKEILASSAGYVSNDDANSFSEILYRAILEDRESYGLKKKNALNCYKQNFSDDAFLSDYDLLRGELEKNESGHSDISL